MTVCGEWDNFLSNKFITFVLRLNEPEQTACLCLPPLSSCSHLISKALAKSSDQVWGFGISDIIIVEKYIFFIQTAQWEGL